MGFFGSVPFTSAEAWYAWTGLGHSGPGAFLVRVSGDAKNYTYGITLERDPRWVGGLKIDVDGWTGPIGPGTTPYTVQQSFSGQYVPKITVAGANQTLLIDVKEIGAEEADEFVQSQAQSQAAATPA
jgi:hypothetical protein